MDTNIFSSGSNPFQIAKIWLEEARLTELNDPDAIALSSVDTHGRPNVRMVLLRYIEDTSFVFFTNYNSTKGKEILNSGNVAFVFHWKSLRRQIRVRGKAVKENGELADEYYAGRSLTSKCGAWASRQSAPLKNREELLQSVDDIKKRFNNDPPRPSFWGGIRVKPFEIEFWSDGKDRLHDRFLYTQNLNQDEWNVQRLSP